jgi:lysine 2,3-aminomutase
VEYDRVRGITYWTKNYRTGIERGGLDSSAQLARKFPYHDPIATLPAEGRAWWAEQAGRI